MMIISMSVFDDNTNKSFVFEIKFLSSLKLKKSISSSLSIFNHGATSATLLTLILFSESHLIIKPAPQECQTRIVFSLISNLSNSFFHNS